MKAQFPGGCPDVARLEPSRFQHYVHCRIIDFRIHASHDSGDHERSLGVRDHHHFRVKRSLDFVQCSDLFVFLGLAYADGAPLYFGGVEGMQGLPGLKQHEIRNVHHVVDRP